jgi:biotin transport system permease protein
MIALYLPGTSPIHRMPAGPKMVAFMALTLAITLLARGVWALPAVFAVVVGGYLVAGLGMRDLLRQVMVVRWVMISMLVAQLVFLQPLVAVANTGRVLAVIVLAALVTLTTRIPDLLDTTERSLAPLRRFGVNPSGIGLLLAMTITAIPVIAGFAASIREAQRARGVPLRLGTFVVPLLVMALKHSDDLADALVARGVE